VFVTRLYVHKSPYTARKRNSIFSLFLGAFAKLRKATISLFMSGC